ncbi:MAG: hypothetical protein J5367_07220, partial [Lachnospiraceae bacterium]|nr:hypothetical protein [Lachnospiraceae bacterium]
NPSKQDVPKEEQEEEDEWFDAEEGQEEPEDRKEAPKEERKDGNVRDMDFAQFQDKVGGPAGKPKEDFAKKRQEILDAKPGLKLGNVNGQPAQALDNNKPMVPGGNQ